MLSGLLKYTSNKICKLTYCDSSSISNSHNSSNKVNSHNHNNNNNNNNNSLIDSIRSTGLQILHNKVYTSCDDDNDDGDVAAAEIAPTLVQEADNQLEDEKLKIRTPPSFESFNGIARSGTSVNTYEGFRFAVQKQVNLQTAVTHFHWMGVNGQPPMYQYGMYLGKDDITMNFRTDLDFNVEGEIRKPLAKNVIGKVSGSINEQQGNSISLDLDINDKSSASQVQITPSTIGVNYMQSITPSLVLGGEGKYTTTNGKLSSSYCVGYDHDNHFLGAIVDKDIRVFYHRKVNPGRVHLNTDLVIDGEGKSKKVTVAAEYFLKQSKILMSLDSDVTVRSTIDTQVLGGLSLTLNAEVQPLAQSLKIGYGFSMQS